MRYLLLFAVSAFTGAFTLAFGLDSFRVEPRVYTFSTEFDIFVGEEAVATVNTEFFRFRREFDLMQNGQKVATGVSRVFAFGALFDSLKKIDFYDRDEQKIGEVDGLWMTTTSGKFAFYDAEGQNVGVAYIDNSKMNVHLCDPIDPSRVIATFRCKYNPSGTCAWKIKVKEDGVIDERILFLFSSFISFAFSPEAPSPIVIRQGGG